MIVSWMFGATIFTLLLGIAALAVERALGALGRATRGSWVVAIGAAVGWPVVLPLWHRFAPIVSTPAIVVSIDAPASASTMIAQQLPTMSGAWSRFVSAGLITAWIVISALLVSRLVFAVLVLKRLQRGAHDSVIDGESVLVTESLGPAVVGVLQPRVAVPAWFMQLDAPLRSMVLRHEREHCLSRDPQLVWLAALSVALMPWNVGLWWLARRLRLALEIDCDARTLRAEPDVDRYGKLLLLIAQRQSGNPLSPMLAESTSHLSRRITAMQMSPLHRPVVRVVLLGSVAIGAVAVACSPRLASDLTGPKTTASPSATQSTSAGAAYFEFQVEKPVVSAAGSIGPKYPDSLRANKIEGRVLAQFVVNQQGLAEVNTLKVLQSDRPEFTESVRTALPNMRFVAAQLKGKAVKQLVQQPFVFTLESTTSNVNTLSANKSGQANTPGANKSALPAHVEGHPYFEFQVDQPVSVATGSVGPKYPDEFKKNGIHGQVLVQFVVDEHGSADASTFKVLKTDSPDLADLVRDALPTMRFNAAKLKGQSVKQYVQQPFMFSASK